MPFRELDINESFDKREFMWRVGLALAVLIYVATFSRGAEPPAAVPAAPPVAKIGRAPDAPKDFGPTITTTDGAKYERGADGRYYRVGIVPPVAVAAPKAVAPEPVPAAPVSGCANGVCPAPSSSFTVPRRGLFGLRR